MFLDLPGKRVEIACAGMRSQPLPRLQRSSCRVYCRIHVSGGALRHLSDHVAGGRVRSVEHFAGAWFLPFAIDEGAEASLMTVQPSQRLFRIFKRRAVLHADKFFYDAHYA